MSVLSLERPMRLVGWLAVLALIVAAFVGYRIVDARSGATVEAVFDQAVGLYAGSDVQMLGVPVGRVTDVTPEGDTVRVTMRLDNGYDAAADTAAVIVAPTLVSDRFIQLTEPYESGEKLTDGTVIGLDRTDVPVEIDQLYDSMNDFAHALGPEGVNAEGSLSEFLDVMAENLDGNGPQINQMLREFSEASQTLADTGEDFFTTIDHLEVFTRMLAENDDTVAQINQQFAAVTNYLAEDRDDLAAALANLGDALAVLDDFIRDNRGNLQTSVENLIGPTQVLVRQRESLEEAVRLTPLALQNFLRAYNPETQVLEGRGNLNELYIWSDGSMAAAPAADSPPLMLSGGGE